MSAGDCKHYQPATLFGCCGHKLGIVRCEGEKDKCEVGYQQRPKKKVTKQVEAWALVVPGITSIYYGEHYAHLRQQEIGEGIVVKLTGTYEVEE